MMKTAMSRIYWSSVATAALLFSAADAQAQQTPWTEPACVQFFAETAKPDEAAAEACGAETKAALGAEDPRLISLYGAVAGKFVAAPKQAYRALPWREQADALAVKLHGAQSTEAAETGLLWVQTMILAGRCEGMDPAVGARLERVRAGFELAPDPGLRADGLRGVAYAFADAAFYERAADTLSSFSPDISAQDWRRVAKWRDQAGDEAGAEDALRRGLDAAENPTLRAIILQKLKKMLFERGDFEGVEALPAD